ncbi:MAG: sugar phosphate isomerase/epimerase, partial [Limosilactobacillus sp.]|nr:sugar phosphate isomerase/epimerase [Limosilactobacillus sp.]
MFLPQLGLKGSSQLDQINDRLQYNPIAYEFYTDANDFTDEGYQRLYDAIQYVKDAGIKNIILHHPMKFQDHHSEVVAPEKQYPDLYRFIEFTTEKLLYLADDLDVQVLVHGGYAGPESRYFVSLYPSVE